MSSIVIVMVVIAIIVLAVRKRNESSPYGIPRPGVPGAKTQPGRSPLQDKLDDWVAADLIDADQADAVLAYEAERVPVRSSRVPLAAEAVGYIGSGLVFASVALVIGNRWDSMSTPARISSLVVPTIVAAVAGWWTGRSDEPALERLGSVLWLLAVAGVGGIAAEVWVDAIHDGDAPTHHAALFIGSITLVAAALAWFIRRVELQQIALFGAAIATLLGIIDSVAAGRDREMSPLAAGLALVALGVVWLTASLARRLPPALLANLLGSGLVLVGAQVARAGNDDVGLWLGLVASMTLMAIGVSRSELEILFVGTVGLFQWTPQIALFYLEDSLGAEATLFVVGAILIGLAGLLTRMYPWVKARYLDRDDGPGERRDDTTAQTHATAATSEKQAGVRRGRLPVPLIIGGSVVALVLVAVISQWFGATDSDRQGPMPDDRGPVADEEWMITLGDEETGAHSVVMIKTFSPLHEDDIRGFGGSLIWEETEVEVCGIGIRSAGEGFVQIGDIFSTNDECYSDTGMQEAFAEFGLPQEACVFVRANGFDDDHCAPLTVGTGSEGDEGGLQEEVWTITPDSDEAGSYIFHMVKTFSPSDEPDERGTGGRFVWPETEIDICGVDVRSIGDGFVQVGILSPTTEGCPGMFEAFVDFGLPETACLFVRVNGVDNEHCAPLTVG